MSAAQPFSYKVDAFNISRASENKIHDDRVAQELGFAGALVPGAEVFAYACHPVVRRWGPAWLERGQMHCRFVKPIYDGRVAIVTASHADGGLHLIVESEQVLCAKGHATLPARAATPPAPAEYLQRQPPPLANRPPADETSLARDTWLGIASVPITRDIIAGYLCDIRETDPIYAEQGIVHPGLLVRLCNFALRENVVMPPWIHTASNLVNFTKARLGDELGVRGRVVDNYERKGHRLVDLDVLIIANGTTPVARIIHTALYRLRNLASAS